MEMYSIPQNDCWVWPFSKTTAGYGTIGSNGKTKYVHHIYYKLAKGPLKSGFDLDHLCRNRGCVNPDHLELVTHRENCLRGAKTLKIGEKCIRGHLVIPGNFKLRKEGFKRCLLCMKEDNNAD